MSDWLRVGGRGRLADGAIVIWSVAEGARGRRWRWVIDDVGVVRHAGLVELDGEGRLTRLELDGSAGLLTLHPDGADGSLHGNLVDDGGVRPISFEGATAAGIVIDEDPFGTALLARAGECGGLRIDRRFAASLTATASRDAPRLDHRGVPHLGEATEWPLE